MRVLKAAGLNPQVDETSNIFVTKAAKKGLEKLPIVLLQAHSDMVGTKADNSLHNFDKDSIKTIVQDG
jgi:dipeptidase D